MGGVLFLQGHPVAFFAAAIGDESDFALSVRRWLRPPTGVTPDGVTLKPKQEPALRAGALEPGMVPALEFLAVLLAVRAWSSRIRPAREARVQVAVRTDSAAAMGAALTWRSPSAKLNEVAKELAAACAEDFPRHTE